MCVLMLRCRSHIWVILTVALTAATCLSAQTANKSPNKVSFEIGPMPSWVKPIEPGSIQVGSDGAGIVYLLADRQENLERNAFYFHEVRKITSQNGQKNGASVSAPFDPAFEKLIFHSIKLTRNGTASNRLDRSRIKLLLVLHKESGLAAHVRTVSNSLFAGISARHGFCGSNSVSSRTDPHIRG